MASGLERDAFPFIVPTSRIAISRFARRYRAPATKICKSAPAARDSGLAKSRCSIWSQVDSGIACAVHSRDVLRRSFRDREIDFRGDRSLSLSLSLSRARIFQIYSSQSRAKEKEDSLAVNVNARDAAELTRNARHQPLAAPSSGSRHSKAQIVATDHFVRRVESIDSRRRLLAAVVLPAEECGFVSGISPSWRCCATEERPLTRSGERERERFVF